VTDGGEMGADLAMVAAVGQSEALDSLTAKVRGSEANVVNKKLPTS